ncbi:MAG TPA: hypothetical protein VGZ23_11045 [bacterium]|nr:hypothetical protein [bacterium]
MFGAAAPEEIPPLACLAGLLQIDLRRDKLVAGGGGLCMTRSFSASACGAAGVLYPISTTSAPRSPRQRYVSL